MRFLLPLFITIPIIEMLILIEVGGLIGAIPTIGLVLLTAVIGLQLLRQQGVSTLLKVNQKLESGQLPANEVVEGLLLAVGGALLLTPGFFTDAIGFACLLPMSRAAMAKRIIAKGVFTAMNNGQAFGQGGSAFQYQEYHYSNTQRPQDEHASDDTIDGSFTSVDDDHLLKK